MDKNLLAGLDRTARFNNVAAKPVQRSFARCAYELFPMRNPGDYLLKDGRRFLSSVWNCEEGIFINEGNKYIVLNLFSAEYLTKAEVAAKLKYSKARLPTLEELTEISRNAAILNQSLKSIGRANQIIPAQISHFWDERSFYHVVSGERRLIALAEARPNFMGKRFELVENNGHPKFQFDELIFAHTNFNEPYKIIQRINKDDFYVLDAVCLCFDLRSWDPTLNGTAYLEDGDLIIENPLSVEYDHDGKYIKTEKIRFRKITGLYAFISRDEGRKPYTLDD